MRLAERTDFALRVLLLLAAADQRRAVPELARSLGVSATHLAKVVQLLQEKGLVTTTRGRGGGVELARPQEKIILGAVVRAIEPDLALVECFRTDGRCPLQEHCGLAAALDGATRAFLNSLDTYSLRDLVRGKHRALLRLTVHSA